MKNIPKILQGSHKTNKILLRLREVKEIPWVKFDMDIEDAGQQNNFFVKKLFC